MDHIFGKSDDISFGSAPKAPAKSSANQAAASRQSSQDIEDDIDATLGPVVSKRPVEAAPTRARVQASEPAPSTPPAPRPPRIATPRKPPVDRAPMSFAPVPTETIATPALGRLIASMKATFLPKEEDPNTLRMVILSDATVQDPLMLFSRDDTTIMVGSGFSIITRAGKTYRTFPDMRLVFSERSHIRAWVLLDDTIDVSLFLEIFPTIEYPPIYATRSVIAKFRDTIQDTSLLEKFRFFEIFAEETHRRIGSIELSTVRMEDTACLALGVGDTRLGIWSCSLAWVATDMPTVFLTKTEQHYMLGTDPLQSWEICIFQSGGLSRHALKFSFDTFFLDGMSVGVEAGYTLTDRTQLAENGVLTFTIEEDIHLHAIVGHIFIDSRGFVHAYEMMSVHKELVKSIRTTYEALYTENPHIERGTLVQGLRREITKHCYLLTGRTPIVMPILIERK